MFGKKKPPLPSYTLQILTSHYLIQGATDVEPFLLSFPKPGETGLPIHLAAAHIQSTAPVDFPPRTSAQFVVQLGTAIIIIPGFDVGRMPQYAFWKKYEISVSGVFYCGPYVIQGKWMRSSDEYLDKEALILDAHITGQIPSPGWNGLTAPFALLNFCGLHGYEPG